MAKPTTAKNVEPVPAGRGAPIPYLCIKGAAKAIDYYKKVFGAEELMRMADPSGRVGHAELKIGEGVVFLADEFPEMGVVGPESLGGSPVTIHLYVKDVDKVAEQATAAGGKMLRPVEDQFYGDRAGKLQDPFGHIWWISTHKEEVSPEEMKSRAAKAFGAS
jgi:PhnB protein